MQQQLLEAKLKNVGFSNVECQLKEAVKDISGLQLQMLRQACAAMPNEHAGPLTAALEKLISISCKVGAVTPMRGSTPAATPCMSDGYGEDLEEMEHSFTPDPF
eukprot:9983875-Karenia_brevis.AAC.1